VCVAVFMSLNYVGNFWKSEYNFCGPSFGKNASGDFWFLLLIWLPIMVLGPVYVLFCTSLVIKSVQQDIRPANTGISTAERFEDRSSNEDFGSNRESDVSFVSVDFASEGGTGDHVRLSEFKGRPSSTARPSEISPLPRLSMGAHTQGQANRSESEASSKRGIWANIKAVVQSLYVYRRIVFLILSSVIALCAAIIIAGTATNIDRYSQDSFYVSMVDFIANSFVYYVTNVGHNNAHTFITLMTVLSPNVLRTVCCERAYTMSMLQIATTVEDKPAESKCLGASLWCKSS
jgi:hypothetical protein